MCDPNAVGNIHGNIMHLLEKTSVLEFQLEIQQLNVLFMPYSIVIDHVKHYSLKMTQNLKTNSI